MATPGATLAERLVAEHLLAPGETILGVTPGTAATIVDTSDRSWRVEAVTEAGHFQRSPGYELYEAGDSDTGPPGPAQGFAILPDGATFHLNEPAALRAFFAAARDRLAPLELAALLASYQSTAPGVEGLVANYDDLAWLFPGVDVAAIPELALPEVEGTPAGALRLRYCTLYLAADPADRLTKVNLNRWQVAAEPANALEWRTEPLARNLASPRHAPS